MVTLVGPPAQARHLEDGYRRCAALTRRHGTTYFWGAAILPAEQRRHVHAVYALCRLADDIVDADDACTDDRVAATTAALGRFHARFVEAVDSGRSDDPVLAAVARTVRECGIDLECFERFFGAMAQDLHTRRYQRWEDLLGYMEGSAAVIGEMMLPVLRPTSDAALGPARALGLAFQLTNFLRDVDEDLDRGRVYLPQEDLGRFSVDPAARRVDDDWRALMRFEIERNRELYREADRGLPHLPAASQRCVRTARVLYSGILDAIEAADYDVFSTRARVPTWRKAGTAARQLGVRVPAPRPARVPLALRPMPRREELTPSWQEARPARIRRALDHALARDPGGWYVVGSSRDLRDLRDRSIARTVGGREVTLWRTAAGRVVAGPGSCPHLGALLVDCEVMADRLYCRWHGLALAPDGSPGWEPFAAHDDGVLLWVRIPTQGEEATDAPTLTARPDPARSVAAVIEVPGTCEPRDVLANRLDPWHGSWFHPYAFSHLTVDEAASSDALLTVDVTFRVSRTYGVPVRAEFACPDARTIVMTIVEGEGAGSVVETHATPLGPGPDGHPRTMMVEATIATSDRAGFAVARGLQGLLRPAMKRTARRLWVDDMVYAERSWLLRARGEHDGV
jgi:phytoene/squalene synthetase/nitrite reductase/ring-hydroxylating ferredoxin subunit